MNILSIDYGTKRIGLAYSVSGVIAMLPSIQNDDNTLPQLLALIKEYSIDRVLVGVSQGDVAKDTLAFIQRLSPHLSIPIETIEEQVSTIEADEIFKANHHPRKKYKSLIDSIAAAVILRRFV